MNTITILNKNTNELIKCNNSSNELIKSASIEAYYQNFIDYLDKPQTTINAYKKNLKAFAIWLESNNITQPTRKDILNYKAYLEESNKAPTTRRAYINTIRQFFNWLDYEGLYKNVAKDIKGAKIDKKHKKEFLTINQVKELLASFKRDTIESKRNYAIIALCITCGLRTIEVVRANIEDIRPINDFMALYVQGKGKQDKADYLKVPYEVEKSIREYIAMRNNISANSPLFASCSDRNNNERLTTRTISKIAKDAFKSIGLNSPYLTAHSLRHTTANINLRNGGTLEETKKLLRHANIETTMIYIKEIEESESKSEQRIASLIF